MEEYRNSNSEEKLKYLTWNFKHGDDDTPYYNLYEERHNLSEEKINDIMMPIMEMVDKEIKKVSSCDNNHVDIWDFAPDIHYFLTEYLKKKINNKDNEDEDEIKKVSSCDNNHVDIWDFAPDIHYFLTEYLKKKINNKDNEDEDEINSTTTTTTHRPIQFGDILIGLLPGVLPALAILYIKLR